MLGIVALTQNHFDRAVRVLGATNAAQEAPKRPSPYKYKARYEKIVAADRNELGDQRFASLWAEGQALSIDEAIEYALE